MVLPGLCGCVKAFSNCDEWGCSSLRCAGFLWWWLLLWGTGSVVVMHGLSCSVACGIFLDLGLNLCPQHWLAGSYPLYHQVSPFISKFQKLKKHYLLYCRAVIAQYIAAMNHLVVIPSLKTAFPDNGVHGKVHNLMNISPLLYFIYSAWISWSEAMLCGILWWKRRHFLCLWMVALAEAFCKSKTNLYVV